MGRRVQPGLVALLLCDQAFQQAGSGNWCIIGVFDTLNAPSLPFTVPQLCAYLSLSDFAGDTVVEMVIRDPDGGVVKAVRGEVPEVPLGLFQYAFPFPDVEFTQEGGHTLELLAGGELITLRSFRVQSLEADPERESEEAEALDAEHHERLLADAQKIWAEHPEAEPLGLIASPDASQVPWFRDAFSAVFGSIPAHGTFVGILDEEALTRLIGGQCPELPGALNPPFETMEKVLTVAIVTKGGFKFAYHAAES